MNPSKLLRQVFTRTGSAIVLTGVVASLWLPTICHYWISVSQPSDAIIELSRSDRSDSDLAKIIELSPTMNRTGGSTNAALAGDRVLEGTLDLRGFEGHKITLPFSPGDLDIAPNSGGLKFASFYAPDVLLDAYEETGRPRYLRSAAEIIRAFADYERTQLRPRGFLWNDHAITARTEVLIRFWRLYRQSPEYRIEEARAAIWLLARCEAFLADARHFTYRTNHGVMQSIALLQAVTAVPSIPGSAERIKVAFERLKQQFEFYVSDEGVVLEHSAGYQSLGIELLHAAIVLATMNEQEVPTAWNDKHRKAETFLSLIVRPDGTLPAFGDTDGSARVSTTGAPTALLDRTQATWFPVSGYAAFRQRSDATAVSHSLVVWSYRRDHGHKHADEMSLMIWARGQSWVTNTGYWPYGEPGRLDVEGWLGANGPHWADETSRSERLTRLESYAEMPSAIAIDLRRTVTGGYFRRQIVSLSGDTWLVLDTSSGSGGQNAEVLWTFAPNLSIVNSTDRYLELNDPTGSNTLHVELLGASGLHVTAYSGSMDPFAGWVVESTGPTPALGVLVRRPSTVDQWSATVFSLNPRTDAKRSRTRVEFLSETNWLAEGDVAGVSWRLKRTDTQLTYVRGSESETATLAAPADVSASQSAIDHAFRLASQRYPRYAELIAERTQLSISAIVLWVVQELAFSILATRNTLARWVPSVRVATMCAWLVGAVWIHSVYLKV